MRHAATVFSVLLVQCFSAEPILAADAAPPAISAKQDQTSWSVGSGAAYVTDYNFRGISQSARHGSVWGSAEARYDSSNNIQWYAGLGAETIRYPNRAPLELDLYAGLRPKLGALSLDLGVWYYRYPGGREFNGQGPLPASCA